MKTEYIFISVIASCLAGCFLTGCQSKEWDNHYLKEETAIDNPQIETVTESSAEYLSTQSEYKKMYDFLSENEVFTTLEKKGQLHTLLVVEDSAFVQPEEDVRFIANSHVTDIAISPSNLYDGERILMWHDKFVTVGIDSLGLLGYVQHITFNESAVRKVIRTADGYIYVLGKMIYTPESLYDYIYALDSTYSIFKELVMASGGKKFDKDKSKPIGVDQTGNTIYDTVWIYTNDFFDAKNFSLSSESLTATMLLFSNEVINEALKTAHKKLSDWDVERPDSILMKWILKVAFFNKTYTREAYEAATDLKSIYDCQWRVPMQEVDLDNPETVSNGIIYKVTKLHIPTNVLIYRLKDYYRNYEYCTADDKAAYFKYDNFKDVKVSTEVTGWTPLPGVWPLKENVVLKASCNDATASYYLQHEVIKPTYDESGNINGVKPYIIPPGTYRFAMGFAQNQGVTYNVLVYVLNGTEMEKIGESTITISSTTEFHYDRGTFMDDTWPEGYKEVKDTDPTISANSKRNNYDTDGGCVIEELTVPDIKEDGSALPMIIRLENATGTTTSLVFNHWCLRPTSNNY